MNKHFCLIIYKLIIQQIDSMGRSYNDYETKMRAFTALMKLTKWLVKKKLVCDVSDEECYEAINVEHKELAEEYVSYNSYKPFSAVRRYERVSFYYASSLWFIVERWFDDKHFEDEGK